jgi:hypothetical protein
MSKVITIRLKKSGNRTSTFSIKDNFGNVLASSVTKKELIDGIAYSVRDEVTVITITSIGKNCPVFSKNIPVTQVTRQDLVDLKYEKHNTSSIWRHLTNPQIYNTYYGVIRPYIIEYPFAYQFHDQILQSVKDFTKAYQYLSNLDGVFNDSRKIQTDNNYFNKAIIYNDQQSSGVLVLEPKPKNNMKAYVSYPKYGVDSKTITFTKSDNFYQYNTFWSVVKDRTQPLFLPSCESLSIDKEINQSNMDYSTRSFKKEPFRGKDVKVRHTLDNSSNTHLVSQFVVTPSQISYK